jgi:DNA-binding MarR family transcriptional regulator
MIGPDRERLSPCVCSTLRMVSRAVTQLYDDMLRPSGLRVTQFSILGAIARLGEANLRQLEHMLAIDQTTLTRSLKLLERDRVIERVPHPDGRVKAMTLTSKGRKALEAARPLWARAQDRVLRELGTTAWADAQRRLAHLLRVAVKKRGRTRGQSRVRSRRARRGGL